MLLIEHEQALYRGPVWAWPTEIWNSTSHAWEKYQGAVSKGSTWGTLLTPEEAEEYMQPI